jgi:hypothetical protein
MDAVSGVVAEGVRGYAIRAIGALNECTTWDVRLRET